MNNQLYAYILNTQLPAVNHAISSIIKLVFFRKINDLNTLIQYSKEYLQKALQQLYYDKQLDSFNVTEEDIDKINEILWTNENIKNFLNSKIIFISTADQLDQYLIHTGQFELLLRQLLKNDFAKFLIAFSMQKHHNVTNAVKALITDKDELLIALKACIKYFYHLNKLHIVTIANSICPLNITDTELDKFSEYVLSTPALNNILIGSIKEISPVKVEAYFNANQMIDDISKLKIEKGQTVPVDGKLVHHISHNNQWIPLVYINGNVIVDTTLRNNKRTIHASIFGKWFNNIDENHDDDIIPYKKCSCNFTNIRKYHGVRAIMKNNIVILIDAEDLMAEAAAAINKKLNCKVLAFVNSFNSIFRQAKLK